MIQQRIDRLRQTLKENNLDSILISNFFNIFYLSNFKTLTENEREAWMLITKDNTYLFSDSRYLSLNQKSNTNIQFKLISPEKGLASNLQEIFQKEKISSCGVEGNDLKVSEFQQLTNYFNSLKIISTDKLIIKQREIKDNLEIDNIKKACEISDFCLNDIIKTIKVGQTEKEIAFKMEFWLKEKNYDLAFYPIVAVDINSAIPHYDTKEGSNKKIKDGSIILIDFGVKYKNYLSDITRMIFVGKKNNEAINTYNKLLESQTKTITKAKNNIETKELDLFCRQELSIQYPHSTGHGVGLEIHEYPKISPTSTEKLITNQVVTIEPGVYYEEKWGMRIEDTVLVKDNKVEVLTKFSKNLLII